MSKRPMPTCFRAIESAPKAAKNNACSFGIRIVNQDDDGPIDIYVTDVIGSNWFDDGVSASDIKKTLAANKGRAVNVEINSPGGLAYDGLSIYNDLVRHDGRVDVTITGLAYSAASIIAMAGDWIRMHQAADFGIHRASVVAWGNQKELADTIKWLANLDEHLIEIYSARTGASSSVVEGWIDGDVDGTLWTAAKAKENGFVDEVIAVKERDNEGASNAKEAIAASAEATRRIMAQHRMRMAKVRRGR